LLTTTELLKTLCGCVGTPGDEGRVADRVKSILSGFGTPQTDALGNVSLTLGQGEQHVLFDAHMDEIGFIVTHADERGFVKVKNSGGVDRRILDGLEIVFPAHPDIKGIICSTPPHLDEEKKVKSPDDIWIDTLDTGVQIRPGDRAAFAPQFTQLLNGRVSASSLDDRAGVAVLLLCLDKLSTQPLDKRITFLFSVQEELGLRGAQTGCFDLLPDCAVSVDVSYAAQPGAPEEKCGKLGGGPMIGFAPSLDCAVTNALISAAQKEEIAFQREVMGDTSGTNADAISTVGAGIPSGLVSVPLRSMHTPVEVVDINDIEQSARLLARFVREGF